MVMEKKKKDEKTVHEDYSFGGRKDADLFRSSHEESSSDLETNSRHGEQDELFTSMETKRVNRSKFFVYLALLCTAVAVSTVTYIFLSREQENNMQVEFSAYSREILKQATANSENMFEEIWDLSKAITSHALFANMSWPNVTLPHFDIRAHDERSRMEFVGFAPFVAPEEREGWETYSVANQWWITQDYEYRGWYNETPDPISETIHKFDSKGNDPWFTGRVRDLKTYNYTDPETFEYEIPLWQVAPTQKDTSVINLDLASHPVFAHLLWDVRVKKVDQYSRAIDVGFLLGEEAVSDGHPRGTIYQPIFEDFHPDAEVVGFMLGVLTWDNMFENVLSESVAPVLVEVEGNCSAGFTYMLTGDEVIFLGAGTDIHDPRFNEFKLSSNLLAPKNSRAGYPPVVHKHRPTDAAHNESHCTYVMNTYPTEEFEEYYVTQSPIYFTLAVAGVFVCTILVFILYDFLVQSRQNKLLTTANQTNAIVSSLFPKEIQKRIIQDAEEQAAQKKNKKKRYGQAINDMTDFLDENNDNTNRNIGGTPIADLFPEATIMFADIVGFTAWSSMREPTQVFVLLETIYNAFDIIAKKRKVFKVETIGDCYVAVAGLPHPCVHHAAVMARFARDCLGSLQEQLRALENELGPDTTDLGIRIGLNSGPVTAGVLRGERARFQLFGDTVNTTSRIETTGAKNRIHVSEDTATILIREGKEHWVQQRNDVVQAKGKGELRTYWLTYTGPGTVVSSQNSVGSGSGQNRPSTAPSAGIDTKDKRLAKFITEMLGKFLRQILARRVASEINKSQLQRLESKEEGNVLDEVIDIIKLPKFNARTCGVYSKQKQDTVALNPLVAAELREYVHTIATMYSHNPFHNFEHAAHVTMSVVKLLSRIVAPNIETPNDAETVVFASTLHDHTYGITSDPLTQFSVVLSALIHDLYHPGVPNNQLVSEENDMAVFYKEKSIAEQKSVDVAWKLLMEPCFSNLRNAIYSNVDEHQRFRQLVVNSVMATDIMDKELGAARKARWEKAFSEQARNDDPDESVDTNRKATIVIEHLIQASDVAHTMQHWHIYRKFNARLFEEMHVAYKNGRSDKNPADGWYEGEIGFFDFYIIPLAKKLKDCGVFGVASDEYLNYAMHNRKEWESKGRKVVAEMVQSLNS